MADHVRPQRVVAQGDAAPRVARDTDQHVTIAITAAELAERVHRPAGALHADALQQWLLEQRLATSRAGRLQLTAHGLEVAAAIG